MHLVLFTERELENRNLKFRLHHVILENEEDNEDSYLCTQAAVRGLVHVFSLSFLVRRPWTRPGIYMFLFPKSLTWTSKQTLYLLCYLVYRKIKTYYQNLTIYYHLAQIMAIWLNPSQLFQTKTPRKTMLCPNELRTKCTHGGIQMMHLQNFEFTPLQENL